MIRILKISLFISMFVGYVSMAQDLLPSYTDYFADNMYVAHPSYAGAEDCAQIRLSVRRQWLGIQDAPQLQVLTFHTGIGEKTGFGVIIFKDKNGYHSQIGGKITYAYHIDFSKHFDVNRLSFGLSISNVNTFLDTRYFDPEDPVAFEQDNKYYFNTDAGLSYRYQDFFAHFTFRNIIKTDVLFDYKDAPVDLSQFVLGTGYNITFNRQFSLEPSTMLRYIKYTEEKFLDLNVKARFSREITKYWAGFSYRKAYNINGFEAATYLTPTIGFDYNNFVFSYAFTLQNNKSIFPYGDFHQITLGFNILCGE